MKDGLSISTFEQEMYHAIRFTKTQQWLSSYYSLLVQGAIFGGFQLFDKFSKKLGPCVSIFVAIISILLIIVVMIFRSKIFTNYTNDLDYYRNTLDSIRRKFMYTNKSNEINEVKYFRYCDLENMIPQLKCTEGRKREKFILDVLKIVFNIISCILIIYIILHMFSVHLWFKQ